MYYREAAAAILVYDITCASTFQNLERWVEELKSKVPEVKIVIVGNKIDLEGKREVDHDLAAQYATNIGALYLETSAKDDLNVQDVFIQLIDHLPTTVDANDSNDVERILTDIRLSNRHSSLHQPGCCS
jgi:GTPase SAR1 family protein